MKNWLVLCVMTVCSLAAHAIDVVDDRGVTVHLPQPPKRIVSLLPSITETVRALGGCSRLVGVDRYSNWPASVRALPQLGGGIEGNALKAPTLVSGVTHYQTPHRVLFTIAKAQPRRRQ